MSIPEVTIIKFSKSKILPVLMWFTIFCSGFVFLYKAESIIEYLIGGAFILAGGFFSYLSVFELSKINKPRITLSAEGIRCSDEILLTWNMITDEKLKLSGSSKPTYYLSFNIPEGTRLVSLYELNRKPQEIMELISYYRAIGQVNSEI